MNPKIYFYNTSSRSKEEFQSLNEGKVGIYACGPTVYWDQHLGNMYAYLFVDILARTLKYFNYEVKLVMNLTDVGHLTSDANSGEDKMEKGAKREGLSVWELAKKYEEQFFESEELLNIVRPNIVCPATEYVEEQIELLKLIEKNGFTYKISDGIYFDTSKFLDYAKFANLKLDEIIDTDRDEVSKEKRNKSDFALWKFSPKNEKRQMEWESPWGIGFPGWHLECTAMSVKNLGETFDIHTGGIDHIPVHHTNEIAQGFGAFGHQTANFWIHNAWVTGKGGTKMSKSLGNVFTAQELVEMGIEPLGYRYLFLTTHYRKGMEFSLDNLKIAQVAYDKLKRLIGELPNGGKLNTEYQDNFKKLIADDLAMPEVMALVWKLMKDEKVSPEDKKVTILDFDKVLGLNLDKKIKEADIPQEIIDLTQKRADAKAAKNWVEADRLRSLINEKGYVVEDLPSGFKIKVLDK
ncbi:MAG: cysteine--tRNA ligase [Candidatus Shapirobacteria bacterium]